MKTIFIVAIFAFGCTIQMNEKRPKPEPISHDPNEYINTGNIKEVVIDSCEYIVFDGHYQGGVCHKGNCKNH